MRDREIALTRGIIAGNRKEAALHCPELQQTLADSDICRQLIIPAIEGLAEQVTARPDLLPETIISWRVLDYLVASMCPVLLSPQPKIQILDLNSIPTIYKDKQIPNAKQLQAVLQLAGYNCEVLLNWYAITPGACIIINASNPNYPTIPVYSLIQARSFIKLNNWTNLIQELKDKRCNWLVYSMFRNQQLKENLDLTQPHISCLQLSTYNSLRAILRKFAIVV